MSREWTDLHTRKRAFLILVFMSNLSREGKHRIYSFTAEWALAFGVNGAILLSNLYFWVKKNRENDVNFHDDRYWTYNTLDAFAEQFPFWSKDQIKRIMKDLRDKGVILVGNYNANKYDRTLWYSVDFDKVESMLMDVAKSPYQEDEIATPIPDVNTNINSIKETYTSSISKEKRFSLTPQMPNQSTECGTPSPINNQKTNPNGGETRCSAPTTTADRAEREQAFREQADKFIPEYGRKMIDAFCDYWTEFGGKKMRFEKEKTWELKRRLQTWKRNDDERKARYQRTAAPTTPDNSLDAKEVLKNLGI